MSICSMTAFVRKAVETPCGLFTWEIRSVNHRYLELSLRLPDFLREEEKSVREMIQKHLNRGKIEATLRFEPGSEVPFRLQANEALVKQLAEAGKAVKASFPEMSVSMMEILSWPGVLQMQELHAKEMQKSVLALLDVALESLVASRVTEGNNIKQFLLARLLALESGVKTIKELAPIVVESMRKKVITRFEELSLEMNSERLEQEMVWLIQKMDIAEELQRLDSHGEELHRILNRGGVVGRRLDFLIQELNREANTLASKLSDVKVTKLAVELKVQIEQMREQVQNIE